MTHRPEQTGRKGRGNAVGPTYRCSSVFSSESEMATTCDDELMTDTRRLRPTLLDRWEREPSCDAGGGTCPCQTRGQQLVQNTRGR